MFPDSKGTRHQRNIHLVLGCSSVVRHWARKCSLSNKELDTQRTHSQFLRVFHPTGTRQDKKCSLVWDTRHGKEPGTEELDTKDKHPVTQSLGVSCQRGQGHKKEILPQGFPELKDKGRKVVYHKDLIGGGQGRRKEPYQRVPSPEGQSPQVFLPSRKETLECSLSLQLQGEHTSLSLQRQDKEETLPQQVFPVLGD